jgi:hypothetical protein
LTIKQIVTLVGFLIANACGGFPLKKNYNADTWEFFREQDGNWQGAGVLKHAVGCFIETNTN